MVVTSLSSKHPKNQTLAVLIFISEKMCSLPCQTWLKLKALNLYRPFFWVGHFQILSAVTYETEVYSNWPQVWDWELLAGYFMLC